jgi:hypothetical protein
MYMELAAAVPQYQQQELHNVGIVVALWASLLFNTLLNKSRWADLFPATS